MWRGTKSGTATGSFAPEVAVPFVGRQSQRITFEKEEGEFQIENRIGRGSDPRRYPARRGVPGQARISFTTRAGRPSVSRWAFPPWWYTSFSWSSPSRCRIVAWKSLGVTTFSAALCPTSSVAP